MGRRQRLDASTGRANLRESSKVRRSNGGQESNRVKRESSRVTPSRGGNKRYKVIARKQRQSGQDRSITSQASSAPRLIRRRGEVEGSERSEGWKGWWEGREASGPGRRRGGIPSRTTQSRRSRRSTKHTQEERTERWHGLLYCNLLQSAAPLAETGPPPQWAGGRRRPWPFMCRYCPQFTRRLYWPLLMAWPNLPRANPTLP